MTPNKKDREKKGAASCTHLRPYTATQPLQAGQPREQPPTGPSQSPPFQYPQAKKSGKDNSKNAC